MTANPPNRILHAAQDIVRLLIQQQYAEIEKMCKGVRISAADIEIAIKSYGKKLCELLPSNGII